MSKRKWSVRWPWLELAAFALLIAGRVIFFGHAIHIEQIRFTQRYQNALHTAAEIKAETAAGWLRRRELTGALLGELPPARVALAGSHPSAAVTPWLLGAVRRNHLAGIFLFAPQARLVASAGAGAPLPPPTAAQLEGAVPFVEPMPAATGGSRCCLLYTPVPITGGLPGQPPARADAKTPFVVLVDSLGASLWPRIGGKIHPLDQAHTTLTLPGAVCTDGPYSPSPQDCIASDFAAPPPARVSMLTASHEVAGTPWSVTVRMPGAVAYRFLDSVMNRFGGFWVATALLAVLLLLGAMQGRRENELRRQLEAEVTRNRERDQAELQVRTSAASFQSLFDSVPVPMLLFERASGRLTAANPAFHVQLGIPEIGLTRLFVWDVLQGLPRHPLRAAELLLEASGPGNGQAFVSAAGGAPLPLRVSAFPMGEAEVAGLCLQLEAAVGEPE